MQRFRPYLLAKRQRAALGEQVAQAPPGHVLHHHVRHAVREEQVVDLDDGGMVEDRGETRPAVEAGAQELVAPPGADPIDGDTATVHGVRCR
jgi:hypothetical protein